MGRRAGPPEGPPPSPFGPGRDATRPPSRAADRGRTRDRGTPFLAGGLDRSPVQSLALGDSDTFGTSVDHDERWVDELAVRLREKGFAVASSRLVAADGIHPSPEQYDRWLERILPAAVTALAADSPDRGVRAIQSPSNRDFAARSARSVRGLARLGPAD